MRSGCGFCLFLFRLFLFLTLGLEAAEFGGVGFELAAEAALLEGEVAEVLLIGLEDEGFEHDGAGLGIAFVGAFVGELAPAEGVEAGFEDGDTQETPFGIGDGLGEMLLNVVGGGEFGVDHGDDGLVGGDVVGGQEDGAAGSPGFHGVMGRDFFTCRRGRAGAHLGVGPVGVELGFGDVVGGGVGRRGRSYG